MAARDNVGSFVPFKRGYSIKKLYASAPPSYQGDSYKAEFNLDVGKYRELSIGSLTLYGQSSRKVSIDGDVSGNFYTSTSNVTLNNIKYNG